MFTELKTLQIWGFIFCFENIWMEDLEELYEVFAGSIQEIKEECQADLTIKVENIELTWRSPKEMSINPRHRGGSSSRKFFLDGTEYLPTSQNRNITAISEGPALSCYEADCMIIAIPTHVTIFASNIPSMLLSDLIENFLLTQAKNRGWLMLHCAGWLRLPEEKVELIVGSSGVGKTTALFKSLKKGNTFFSNDRAFLRIHENVLEARSFPLPVNIGCGTIRSLDLPIPHHNFDDHDKIRLTSSQVKDRFGGEYEKWYPVDSVLTPSLQELEDNIHWHQDDCHPFWNKSFHNLPINPELEHKFKDKLSNLIKVCERKVSNLN